MLQTYVTDKLIANIDAEVEGSTAWDPSSVGSDEEQSMQVMLNELKSLGMELERQKPQEWNQFMNACLYGSSTNVTSSNANSIRGSLTA